MCVWTEESLGDVIHKPWIWDCCPDMFMWIEENGIQREWKKIKYDEAWITWKLFDNIQNIYIIHCLYGF